ncbi:right-handed parallel beta-helix repeat-containing protein [bacterium]|nr:right-handed parallel beta-helix repeat-containing protein [bacterium]
MKQILVGVLLMMTTFTGWTQDAAAPPHLNTPADSAATVSPFPRFFWEALPGTLDYQSPISYDIELARDTDFGDVADRDRVNLARYVVDRPLEPGDYFWRVRAVSPDGKPQAWSEARALKITPCDETIRVDLKGSGEALPALRAALARASELSRSGRSVRVEVPKGNYSLTPDTPQEKECFLLRDVSNIIVDFGGSYFGVKRWGAAFTRSYKCRDIAYMNAMVDWDEEIPFTEGIVTAKDPETEKITIRIEPGFPEFDAPHFVRGDGFGLVLHPTIPGRMKAGTPIHFGFDKKATVKKGDRLWELQMHGKDKTQYFDIGDRFVKFARSDGGQSLCDSHECERVSYYGITSYTTGGGGHYAAFYDTEMAILHCRELIKEGRWYGGNADGIHAKGHRVGPWVEDLVVDGVGDDSIAFYTRPSKIHAAHVDGNPRVFLFYEDSFNLEAGDEVVFFNPREGIFFAEATVRESTPEGEYHRVTFDRDLPMPEEIGPDLQKTDQVWNRSKTCGDFMIRDCRLTNVRRFGAVFRALRGVLENNYMEATSSSGILSLNEPWYPNGPMSSEILIQNNTFKNNCLDQSLPFGSIAFFLRKYPHDQAVGRGTYNILIRNNTIIDWQKHAIQISGAENVTVENNKILSEKEPFIHDGNVAIRVHNSKGITFKGNTLRDNRMIYEPSSITETENFTADF